MLIKFADHLKPVRALNKPHKGIVVDNEDPKKLGRVKCTVSRLFEEAKEKLPWIFPELEQGSAIPKMGTELIIVFPYNDIYSPFYSGFWHSEKNHKVYFDDDYPNTSGFELDNLKGKFNDKSKDGELAHSSGTRADIKADGAIDINVAKDFKVTVKAGVEFASDTEIKMSGKAGIDFSSDGNAKFVGKGGTDIGDGGSVTNVKGSSVMLAGGGAGVALLGSQCMGTGNLGAPVVSNIVEGSSKVFAPK